MLIFQLLKRLAAPTGYPNLRSHVQISSPSCLSDSFAHFFLLFFFFFLLAVANDAAMAGGRGYEGGRVRMAGTFVDWPWSKNWMKKKRKKIAPPPVERRASVLSKCSRVSDWTRVHGLPGAMRTLWRREGVLSRGGNLRGWPVGAV